MSSSAHGAAPYYFVPDPSKWPMVGSIALALFGFGMVGWTNGASWGPYALYGFGAVFIYMLFGWIGMVASESEGGKYNERVDTSFRWSMSWFIFSEVMFFAAFFGALWYARVISMPWLGDLDTKALIWPDFVATWPNAGPAGIVDGFYHAYNALNLKLTSGIYGSTFFMLTGFHGFHVTVGAIMLTVVLFRLAKGHFNSKHHFAFEGAAWYWHFVDVVWLGLYVVVYWL